MSEKLTDLLLVSLGFSRVLPRALRLIATMMCAVRWGHICGAFDAGCAMRRARPNRNIEPSLAKAVAEGDACPITLLPMEDINPGYVPRALKPIPMNRQGHRGASASTSTSSASVAVARPDKGKGRAKEGPPEKPGLLKFFGKSALRIHTPPPLARRGLPFGLAGVLTFWPACACVLSVFVVWFPPPATASSPLFAFFRRITCCG